MITTLNRDVGLLNSMKRVAFLLLVLCLCAGMARPVFSEPPLRLYFKKNISESTEQQTTSRHTVQRGEWLNRILKSKGYSARQIPQLLPAIRELNPQIQDLNQLRPGQILYLPDTAPASAPRPQPAAPSVTEKRPDVTEPTRSTPPAQAGATYIVRQGDTLSAILARQGISTAQIFSRYIQAFKELNPDIQDVNTLHIGQEVVLPGLPSDNSTQPAAPERATPEDSNATDDGSLLKALTIMPLPENSTLPAGNGTANAIPPQITSRLLEATADRDTAASWKSLTLPSNPTLATKGPTLDQIMESNATAATPARKAVTGIPFIRTVLEKMRFSFAPGDENMYSIDRTRWLQVNLKESPIIELPWGGKAILTRTVKSDAWIADANRVGFHVCPVTAGWSPSSVIASLAETFPDCVRLWAGNRNLTFSHAGLGLTLRAPCLTIIRQNGRKKMYMVWAREAESSPLPQGLHEVLEDAGVDLIELDAYNELSRLPARPRGSVYIPVPSHLDIIRAMNPDDPETLFGATLPRDLNSLLFLLKDKGMLQRGMIQLDWNAGPSQSIAIQVPAVTIHPSATKIALLRSEDADENIVSLLSRQGYNCFQLP